MTSKKTDFERTLRVLGAPNERQRKFFESRCRFTAYGGARGGGKSWALRRKLIALCLHYSGISCLLVRRSLAELKSNHLTAILRELGDFVKYSESERTIEFPNGSKIALGYCSSRRDALRYQGQEYDIIAIDEATQLTEYHFSVFKACLRGVNGFPKRIYLTCNPGGVGHAWVKRLFIDRDFREGEKAEDYLFIPAKVYDNRALLESYPEYVTQLESLPDRMKKAWLEGRWDVFEGQFFPELDSSVHICRASELPKRATRFIAFDYGFDMLAAILFAVSPAGDVYAEAEYCSSGLTLSAAAERVAALSSGVASYAVASPDLWNRRQDSGKSGFEIMQAVRGMPPMTPADDRRVAGWRVVREYLSESEATPRLFISERCPELFRCMSALLSDPDRPEDASGEPHSVTHLPEALRYGLMSRAALPAAQNENGIGPFIIKKRSPIRDYLD